MSTKVLIIEDHDDFRGVIREHLEAQEMDFEILEAASGELGILKAMKEKPDVVLMDIRLPNIHGLDAASRIKGYLPQCKIIILTMFETEAFRKAFKSTAITAYLGKSELYDRLIPILEEHLL